MYLTSHPLPVKKNKSNGAERNIAISSEPDSTKPPIIAPKKIYPV
jgi:hypothetical protein|tara:strand:- start:669 stop:803 length:135 start_codon:yes stop_codon:yes gene_type:complete